MTKQQAAEKYSNDLIEELKNVSFPDESLAPNYNDVKASSLFYISFANIQQLFPITWDEYKAIHSKFSGFTLFEVQVINTIASMRTPKELAIASGNYIEQIEAIMKMGDVYNELVAPISERIQKRIEIMSAPNGAYKETPVRFIK
jgi:hypothetical protein